MEEDKSQNPIISSINIEQQAPLMIEHGKEFISSMFPIVGRKNRVDLRKISVVEDKTDTYAKEMEAKDNGRTVGPKIQGELELKDSSGKVIDRQKLTLMQIPRHTERGSFIVGGNEYHIFNQMRLDPAVYTYKDQSGDVQTQFNMSKGSNFKIKVDPKSQKFRMQLGTQNIDAYPLIKAMGVTDERMQRAWGNGLWDKNRVAADPKALEKIHKKVIGGETPGSSEKIEEELREYFLKNTEMLAETNKKTIGIESRNVDGDTLLAATKKNIDVATGKANEDERDHLEYQTLLTAPDIIKHRFEHARQELAKRMKFKIDHAGKVGSVVNRKTFSKPIETFFTSSELSASSEQINPVHNYFKNHQVTRMGEGGISDSNQITRQARNTHPSQFGFVDPYESVESSRIGITTALAQGAFKGKGGRIMGTFYDAKAKRMETLSPEQLRGKIVSAPDEFGDNFSPKKGTVKAIRDGDFIEVKPSQVDYIFPNAHSMHSIGINLIPMQESDQGNRKMMAAKQISQHDNLVAREIPLVQVSRKDGAPSLEKEIGKNISLRADSDGVVKKVNKDYIDVQYGSTTKRHPIYDDFFLNQKSYNKHFPTVKPGDSVSKGQVLADSQSSKDGVWAPGLNLRTAYMPYKGMNFEDGVVISEGAAKKMTSMHQHKVETIPDDLTIVDKQTFVRHFPATYSKDQLEKIDENGMAKKGTQIGYGDPVMLQLRRRQFKPEDIVLGRVAKKFATPFTDASETWKYEFPGKVSRNFSGNKKVVRLTTEEPMVRGDKIGGRHGNKGIVTNIIPDHEMPKDSNGDPVELILNPQGIPGRINPGQLHEALLGKVAKKTGQPVVVPTYMPRDNASFVLGELKKNRLEETEELFDPTTGHSLGKILTGYPTILKLDHPVRKKIGSRGVGPNYTSELSPGRGDGGGQSIGSMEVKALLAHGAKENLREMSTIKSDKNDDFWYRFQAGMPYTLPKRLPFVTEKLFTNMRVLGVNPEVNGQHIQLTPVTSEETEANSNGEVRSGRLLKSKDVNVIAEKGGIFDPKVFGGSGVDGTKWGHISLKKKIPNPLFEDAVKGVLGLTQSQYDGILFGKYSLGKDNEIKTADDDLTGPEAIEKMLSDIDRDVEYAKLKKESQTTKSKTKRDAIFKRLKFLRGLKKMDLQPSAYMIDKIPVTPPKMRPVVPLPDGNMIVPDINYGYKDVLDVNSALGEIQASGLERESEKDLVSDLYKATKALQGFGTPISYGKEFGGVVDTIKGSRNKIGYFQNKVIKRRQEMSGRSTVIPDPSFGIDEVGIPENMAWTIFKPHVMREMAPFYSKVLAKKMIDDKDPAARRFLASAMSKKKILFNRAPTLHKGSIMALRPRPIQGDAIKVPNLIVGPLGLDFDGDTASIHVPVSAEANKEAEKMLPSNMLFNPRDRSLFFTPSQEMILGLYTMTKSVGKDSGLSFSSAQEGYENLNKVGGWSNQVTIGGKKSTLGQHFINSRLPRKYQNYVRTFDKGSVRDLLEEVAHSDKELYGEVVDALKEAGNIGATGSGNTVTLGDMTGFKPERDRIISEFEADKSKIKRKGLAQDDEDFQVSQVMNKRMKQLEGEMMKFLSKGQNNNLYNMVHSGSRGNPAQARQIMAAPFMLQDYKDKPMSIPVRNSYLEGQGIIESLMSAQSARSGTIDKVSGVSEPGMYAKLLTATNVDVVITETDCGTLNGTDYSLGYSEGRHLAKSYPGVGQRNSMVDNATIGRARAKGLHQLMVRTQLGCEAKRGICALCYGANESGRTVTSGDNVGTIDAHSMSEPLTQMSMRAFHVPTVKMSTPITTGFDRAKELYKVPEKLPNSAVLSELGGSVEKITRSPAGGLDISIGGVDHYSPSSDPTVKIGDTVKKGQQLSSGHVRPQDVLRIKGIDAAQKYMIEEYDKAFQGAGVRITPRVFETIVNKQTGLGKVTDSKHPDILAGDVTKIRNLERESKKFGGLDWENLIRPVERVPSDDKFETNMFQQMGFREIAKSIKETASMGNKIRFQNTIFPAASYLMGNFGRDDKGNKVELY